MLNGTTPETQHRKWGPWTRIYGKTQKRFYEVLYMYFQGDKFSETIIYGVSKILFEICVHQSFSNYVIKDGAKHWLCSLVVKHHDTFLEFTAFKISFISSKPYYVFWHLQIRKLGVKTFLWIKNKRSEFFVGR